MIRECKRHGLTEYFREGKAKHLRCRKCRSEAVQRRRLKVKSILVNEAGGKCVKCGYNKCMRALHFHHRDSKLKEFGIAAKGFTRSIEALRKEMQKCDLLCSNCHMEEEEKLCGLSF